MRAVVVVIVLGLVACTKPNPNRCCTDQADCAAAGIPVGTSCGSDLVCRGNQCIAETCASSNDCDLSSPFCVDSSCTSMCTSDDQCPGNGGDPTKAHCEGGACVVCRAAGSDCPAATPVCDMGMCRACQADSECSSGVCDLDSSACIDSSKLVYASPSGGSASTCTMVDPCTLSRAFTVADASRPNVKLLPGTYSTGAGFSGTYTLSVYGPATVTGFSTQGNGGTLRLRHLTLGSATCQIFASNAALPSIDLEDVSITNDNSIGLPLDADSCRVRLERVVVTVTTTNTGAAVIFDGTGGSGGSMVTMDRVSINGGDPGISLSEVTSLNATNSVFNNQGTNLGAISWSTSVSTTITGTVAFSTFHNSLLKCRTGNLALGFSNNIFFNEASGAPTDTVSGNECSHSYDLIKPQATAVGTTNLLNMDPRFVNAAMGDFHLMMGSPAIDAADPAATLSTDYDGVMRPQGSARDIGAFEYKP